MPTSAGAVFGACLVLFLISVVDRYLQATCRMERRFSQRTKQLAVVYYFTDEGLATSDSKACNRRLTWY
ncbi:hypothetical protein DFH07DRAFT_951793 [Mycena maculata]|uniref:Secreted protein n=1 Tax=Mycena maculata TaxID=230809 RepID=A0AAD7K6J9_9AGAR|nr:hypothetical protein DFH07DRAFT_951793 [Mycena maculata]